MSEAGCDHLLHQQPTCVECESESLEQMREEVLTEVDNSSEGKRPVSIASTHNIS